MIDTAQTSPTAWGNLPGGPAHLFTLRNAQGMKATFSDFGATLVSWQTPDRSGRLADIVLGYDTPAEYLASNAYMGALIGRWANRIALARFELDGVVYPLDRNEGRNQLHGGAAGFHRALWEADEDDGALVMRLDSPEGDAGFPGNVAVQVRYTLDDDGTLGIEYEASTDATTPLNLTSHPYFNLTGVPGADIRGHMLTIAADRFFEVDAEMIPTQLADVAGSAFDFRQSAPIGARLDWPHAQLAQAGGFDHCYVLHGGGPAAPGARPVREVARVYDPRSGRELTVSTDRRALQFYTANGLGGTGRGGRRLKPHGALCLEAGAFPNQVNMGDRDDVLIRPGRPYRQVTQYRVGTAD